MLSSIQCDEVDPTDTAKVFSSIVERFYCVKLKKRSSVLFFHSVGLARMFGYQNELVTIFS